METPPTPPNFPVVRARMELSLKLTPLGSLRSSQFGRLVAVKGTVVRISNIRPVNTWLAFQCLVCTRYGTLLYLRIVTQRFRTPVFFVHQTSPYRSLVQTEPNCRDIRPSKSRKYRQSWLSRVVDSTKPKLSGVVDTASHWNLILCLTLCHDWAVSFSSFPLTLPCSLTLSSFLPAPFSYFPPYLAGEGGRDTYVPVPINKFRHRWFMRLRWS